MTYTTGNLRRVKKDMVTINNNHDVCSTKIMSCSFKQTIANEKWNSGYHRNKKYLANITTKYFIDNNYVSVEELVEYLLDSKLTSDFQLFGLLMKWGKNK